MGSVCPSCYREKWNEMWTQEPDESPRLCARHIQKEHPNDICAKCRTPWSAHGFKDRTGKEFTCERWFGDAEGAPPMTDSKRGEEFQRRRRERKPGAVKSTTGVDGGGDGR
jgi:hypothetical protein